MWAVVWVSRGRARRAVVAIALLVALGAVKGLVGAQVVGLFGVAHVLYLDIVVVLPVAGLALLVAARGRLVVRIAGAALLLFAPLGAYGSFVEPGRLVVERARVEVPELRAGNGRIEVAVLSDLQFREVGKVQREAVDQATRAKPDVILLPGDIHQGDESSLRRELPEIRTLLTGLSAPGGVYFVVGDVEGVGEARRVLSGTGVRLLHDEVARVVVGDRQLTIGGIQRDWQAPGARRTVRRLESGRSRRDLRILLSHRPDAALTLRRNTRVDLVVSGHTHGGQIQIPFFGPPFDASGVPRKVGGGGLHSLGGRRRVYVSRGIGLERGEAPRVRLLARPELSLLTLE